MKKIILTYVGLMMALMTGAATCTYWTSDGQEYPLPENGDLQVLLVPAQAVAVDFRGLNDDIGYVVDASAANPNCLYYFDRQALLPKGMEGSRNVIRGMNAVSIQVTDGYDFYCPLAFTAQYISYLVRPSYNNPNDEQRASGYVETIVLPFKASYAILYDVNNGTSYAELVKVLGYDGDSGNMLSFSEVKVTDMQAYVPYILGVYIGSRLLFLGENTEVPVTREAVSQGSNYNFVGTTVAKAFASGYQYNAAHSIFYQSESYMYIPPFRATIFAADNLVSNQHDYYLYFNDDAWGVQGNPTGGHDQPTFVERHRVSTALLPQSVFNLAGRRVSAGNLKKGFYIIDGKKVVVK